jgi:hypothetical protein
MLSANAKADKRCVRGTGHLSRHGRVLTLSKTARIRANRASKVDQLSMAVG